MNQNIFNENNPIIVKRDNKLSIIVIIVLVLLGMDAVYNAKTIINSKLSKEQKNAKYILVKYSDYNKEIDYIYDATFYKDYLSFFGHHQYSGKRYYSIFKDGKQIDLGLEDKKFRFSNLWSLSLTSIIDLYEKNPKEKAGIKSLIQELDKLNVSEVGNTLWAKKEGKYGVIDKYGQIITDFIYDSYQDDYNSIDYFYAELDGKVGIVDSKGKIIIPLEYDYLNVADEYGKYVYGRIIQDEETYFIMKYKNENVVLDIKNKEIIRDRREIEYDSILNYFVINKPNTKIFNYYNIKGKLIGSVNFNNYFFGDKVFNPMGKTPDLRLFYDINDPSIVYGLDKDLFVTKFDNIYTFPEDIDSQKSTRIFLNEDVYLTFEEGKYYLRNTVIRSVIDNYIFFSPISFEHPNPEKIIVCKEEKKCGLIDLSGNNLTTFNYEYIVNELGYKKLKNDTETIFIANNGWKKSNCDINDDIDYIHGNFYISHNYIYNDKCKRLANNKYNKFKYLDNGFMIYGEKVIFDNNGKKITYHNPANAKLKQYITFYDNKMYFLTDKGIYFIEKN